MNIVFIHGNYPAQFRHLAEMLGRSGDHRVIFSPNGMTMQWSVFRAWRSAGSNNTDR